MTRVDALSRRAYLLTTIAFSPDVEILIVNIGTFILQRQGFHFKGIAQPADSVKRMLVRCELRAGEIV